MILCVTGPMAAGKNTVSDILGKKGFTCIDADILAHKAIANRTSQILEAFSKEASAQHIELRNSDGTLNRKDLGSLIFPNPELLARQEAIVHPEINRLLEKFISEHPGQDIVLNATVLYKVAVIKQCSAVIYVDAPGFLRFFRAKKRDIMKNSQILARFRAQNKLFAKYKFSNADIYRVWNVGNISQLKKKIDLILEKCRQRGF